MALKQNSHLKSFLQKIFVQTFWFLVFLMTVFQVLKNKLLSFGEWLSEYDSNPQTRYCNKENDRRGKKGAHKIHFLGETQIQDSK